MAAGLWLALNHPVGGLHVRTQVAASMRTQNRAQLTVTSDGCQRWCFVVSDRLAMPEALMETTPIGLMVCLEHHRIKRVHVPMKMLAKTMG